jgi:tRNA dimethylallyltransferase
LEEEKPAIAIVGPTGSGKTHLAIALAVQFRGEIVSCDALQVYRRMDIGTAKATVAEQALVTHHMLDVRNPDEDFSAGDYQRQARQSLKHISESGRLPFVTGGTGFYLRALIEGLFEGPGRSEELRRRMRTIAGRKGSSVLHRALARVDPESAARIAANDAERIIRAYEMYLVSGKSMSWWQEQSREALKGYRWLKIGIDFPREQLYIRIDRRVDEMFAQGFVDEVKELLKSFPRESNAFKAIGYRQVAEHLEGRLTMEQALEETKRESRRYAKRQLTWFRSDREIIWLDGQAGPQALHAKAADLVSDFLNTGKPEARSGKSE